MGSLECRVCEQVVVVLFVPEGVVSVEITQPDHVVIYHGVHLSDVCCQEAFKFVYCFVVCAIVINVE